MSIDLNSAGQQSQQVDRNGFARACREACRPLECSREAACWVEHGTRNTCRNRGGAPRCQACNGLIREVRRLAAL